MIKFPGRLLLKHIKETPLFLGKRSEVFRSSFRMMWKLRFFWPAFKSSVHLSHPWGFLLWYWSSVWKYTVTIMLLIQFAPSLSQGAYCKCVLKVILGLMHFEVIREQAALEMPQVSFLLDYVKLCCIKYYYSKKKTPNRYFRWHFGFSHWKHSTVEFIHLNGGIL